MGTTIAQSKAVKGPLQRRGLHSLFQTQETLFDGPVASFTHL